MKTIKLKNATLELSAEDIAELRKQLEEPKSWPQEGDEYYIYDRWNKESVKVEWRNHYADQDGLARGELFRTKEECEEDDKKRRALVRIKDFIRKEGLEFEPDWNPNDIDQEKHIIEYSYIDREFMKSESIYLDTDILPLTGYFRTHEDKIKVIDNCEADLKILFNII